MESGGTTKTTVNKTGAAFRKGGDKRGEYSTQHFIGDMCRPYIRHECQSWEVRKDRRNANCGIL